MNNTCAHQDMRLQAPGCKQKPAVAVAHDAGPQLREGAADTDDLKRAMQKVRAPRRKNARGC